MPGVEFWCAELSSKNLMVIRLILAALLCLSGLSPVLAIPARIIILRHGEKADKVRDLMVNPLLQGKTVVMVWEHRHIANKKLEDNFPREAVTLRQLLKLDLLHGVPETWPSGTYDYFWIVDYGTKAPTCRPPSPWSNRSSARLTIFPPTSGTNLTG
jgi:hypothetical protein